MNKKLRLLVTTQCPNKCPVCCNDSWDFSKLPVVDRWDYEVKDMHWIKDCPVPEDEDFRRINELW
jgi:hypothetical protein